MEKRSLLALVLSILVLLLWSVIMPKPQTIANKSVNDPGTAASLAPVPVVPSEPAAAAMLLVMAHYQDPRFDITFDETTAAINEVKFKEYQDHKFVLNDAFLILDNNLRFSKVAEMSNSVTFVHSDSTKKITKEYIFSNLGYTIDLRINVQSLSSQPLKLDIPLSLGTLDFMPANAQARFQGVIVETGEKTLYLGGRKEKKLENIKFAALREKYFAAITQPQENDYTAYVRKLSPRFSQVVLVGPSIDVMPGQSVEHKFRIYLGPQVLGLLNQADPHWSAIMNYGTFDFIAQLLLHLLNFFYSIVHNWGWAIIILSIAVYVVLYPLTLKQMQSMKGMQAIQPKIEELRKLYKDNPQKLNKEMMELYRVHKVNPFGGCLPLLLQMPIFFALYQVLLRSISLKGAQFLWIKDLSEPDRLFMLPASLPVVGNQVNILPILMAVVMFFQQKMSMAGSYGTSGGTSEQQQKMMSIIFPFLFGFIFYRMPSGLVLYWFVNSGLVVISQYWSKRLPAPAGSQA